MAVIEKRFSRFFQIKKMQPSSASNLPFIFIEFVIQLWIPAYFSISLYCNAP